ncbi:MAG TPA: hypothetical protein VK714_06615 [Myxococcota bacterium]|nr:hypothetical protein [Myxococcota bacterium]
MRNRTESFPMRAERFKSAGRKINTPPTATRLGLGEVEAPGVLILREGAAHVQILGA